MKKYREAKTDKEKKRGKSTDELSFKEALNFFKKRGKDKGASKFRWRGDVYNLDGDKVGGSKKTSASTNTTPKTSKRPQTPSTGNRSSSSGPARYDSTKTRMSSGPSTRRGPATDKSKTSAAEKAKTKLLRSAGISYDNWEGMTRKERREEGLPETTVGWQNQELVNDPIGWMKKQLGLTAKIPSTGSKGRTQNSDRNYTQEDLDRRSGGRRTGMAKGGMVRKGNANYKGKGMFYKSASPRGYK